MLTCRGFRPGLVQKNMFLEGSQMEKMINPRLGSFLLFLGTVFMFIFTEMLSVCMSVVLLNYMYLQ